MKAQCPKNKPVNAATVHFGCIEAERSDPAQRMSQEGRWARPKRPVRLPTTPTRPMPSKNVLGDYLKPSVFVRATELSHADEETPAEGAPRSRVGAKKAMRVDDSDDESWIAAFEERYGDICRLPQKEKHQNQVPEASKKVTKSAQRSDPSREINVMEVIYPDDTELMAAGPEVPKYTTLKVALDSGAGAHVMNMRDAPGCAVSPSAMSKAGAAFLAADGGRIQNHGEMTVNMVSFDSKGGAHQISSRFEAADVTRALWSVGLICDSGLSVQFSSEKAVVMDKHGTEICMFARSNGLYVAEVKVENPMHEGFHRQGN